MPKGLGDRICVQCATRFYGAISAKFCSVPCQLRHHVVESDTGCWVWRSRKYEDGYGQTHWRGKYTRAHRVSYSVFVAEIPLGRVVCHSCDNRACINPEHLFVGTPAENSADMVRKSRSLRGARHHKAKLSEEDVRAIRADKRSGKAIGEDYGIADTNVYRIKHRKAWRHVT